MLSTCVHYLCPVVLKHNHTGFRVDPFQRERLLPVAANKQWGHHFDWLSGGYSMFQLSMWDGAYLMWWPGITSWLAQPRIRLFSWALQAAAGLKKMEDRVNIFIIPLIIVLQFRDTACWSANMADFLELISTFANYWQTYGTTMWPCVYLYVSLQTVCF